MDISYRTLSKEEFPPQLMEIPEPPKTLFLAGTLPPPPTVLLTVVGARKHSPYGKDVCESLIAGLKGYDIAIVSGLALGIDAIAHEAAMRAGLHTIAVPGSGLDSHVLYPRAHVGLARRILEHNGALLSEFPPDTAAATWTFPKRNRIMAGLAQATLLIEAETKSGTLITARLAADYNKDVLAVPGSIFSALSDGPNLFLTIGATPIRNASDILHALGFTPQENPGQQLTFEWDHLTPEEKKVMEILALPYSRDALIAELGLSISAGNILLMKMEIAGLITETEQGVRRC